MLHAAVSEHPARVAQKIILLSVSEGKITLFHALVPHHGFLEYRRDGHHALLVVLAVDDDVIIMYVTVFDATQLKAPNASLKQHGEYGPVSHIVKVITPAAIQQHTHIAWLEGSYNRLLLLNPLEAAALGIEAAHILLMAILYKALDGLEASVDIGALAPFLHHGLREALNGTNGHVIRIRYAQLLLAETLKDAQLDLVGL